MANSGEGLTGMERERGRRGAERELGGPVVVARREELD
jgi:hypothetical protein